MQDRCRALLYLGRARPCTGLLSLPGTFQRLASSKDRWSTALIFSTVAGFKPSPAFSPTHSATSCGWMSLRRCLPQRGKTWSSRRWPLWTTTTSGNFSRWPRSVSKVLVDRYGLLLLFFGEGIAAEDSVGPEFLGPLARSIEFDVIHAADFELPLAAALIEVP